MKTLAAESFTKKIDSTKLHLPSPNSSKNWRLKYLFAIALGLTLFNHSGLLLARAGWTLLAILFVLDFRYAIYSLFFHAAWFHPTGFLPNFTFTIKHYHLAFFLAATVHLIKGQFFYSLKQGLKDGKAFYPILFIIAIGFFNYLRFEKPVEAIRILGNISIIMASLFYLMGIFRTHPSKSWDILQNSLVAFTVGVAVELLVTYYNTIFKTRYLNIHIIHDNHMGVLSAIAFFYSLSFFAIRKSFKKIPHFILASIILAGIIASCSRTAWMSFLMSFFIFIPMISRAGLQKSGWRIFFEVFFPFIALSVIFSVVMCYSNELISARIIRMREFLDPVFWDHTSRDFDNFSFLGKFRLNQFEMLQKILWQHPFFGIGFIREVVDFHGLYFSVWGGAGLVGLATVGYFCRNLLQNLLNSFQNEVSQDMRFLKAGVFCALLTWLFCCLMETYFVQFSPWLAVLAAALMAFPALRVEESS